MGQPDIGLLHPVGDGIPEVSQNDVKPFSVVSGIENVATTSASAAGLPTIQYTAFFRFFDIGKAIADITCGETLKLDNFKEELL